MTGDAQLERDERDSLRPVRALADQAFSRAAGAPLIPGNHVRLLKDARENYPAWLDAIRTAKHNIHFESGPCPPRRRPCHLLHNAVLSAVE